MGTTEKLKVAKEILATSFLNATERSIAHGMEFSYKSYGVEEDDFKGWIVDILVKEAGYGEKAIQQFKYHRPNNIDAKSIEYHVIVDVIGNLTQGALISWYEVAKMLASDKILQKAIIDEAKKDNISTDKSE
jgi:hypothetical protein